MTLRRLIYVSHRYCGLTAALFLLIAAATGSLLVFRDGLDAALNPDLFDVAAKPVLPATEVVSRAERAHPDWQITQFDLRTSPGETLRVSLGGEQAFLDPSDGRLVGTRGAGPGFGRRRLVEGIYLLHYTLLAGTAGRWFMGLVALFWLGLNILGLCITWPRRKPWLLHWRPALRTTRHAFSGRPLPELHRLSGLWLIPFLTVLAYTSVAMNFYGEAFQPLVEAISPPRAGDPSSRPALPPPPGASPIGFAEAERIAVAAARTRTPNLRPVTMSLDASHHLYAVGFSPGGTHLYKGYGHVTYDISAYGGRLAWLDQPKLDGRGRLVLRSLYPLHSGQIAGLPTRLLVLALGLVTIGLVVTGILPWWRRRRRLSDKRTQ